MGVRPVNEAYIFIAMVAMVATYLYTPLIRHLAIQLGAVGEVRARDVHTVPTPRMGGVAMLLGFITAMFFASSSTSCKANSARTTRPGW